MCVYQFILFSIFFSLKFMYLTMITILDIGLGNENCTTSKEVDMTDEIVEANGFPPSATR